MAARRPVIDRVMDKCEVTGRGCWVFTGTRSRLGYGMVSKPGKSAGMRSAHRVTYEFFVGPVPDGLELDHLCRVRACCNPWHLDPVPHRVNMARAQMPVKTHCIHGHEFTEENTHIRPSGARQCRECGRAAVRRYRRKRA